MQNGKVVVSPLIRGRVDNPHNIDTCATEWKVVHDHSYTMDVPQNVFFPSYDHESFNIPIPPQHDVNVSSEDTANAFVNGNESDADDDEDLDPNWQLTDDDRILSDNDIVPSEDEFQESSPDNEKKNSCFWVMPK